MKTRVLVMLLLQMSMVAVSSSMAQSVDEHFLKKGLSRELFKEKFSEEQVITYRREGDQEWRTYRLSESAFHLLTAQFQRDQLVSWTWDDRQEAIRQYLTEFCSQAIIQHYPRLYQAIAKALQDIPWDVFLEVTDRQRPVLFTEYSHSGQARWANSSEVRFLPDDIPAFQQGFSLIKLSAEMEQSADPLALEGVILHELAHRYLGHLSAPYQRDYEREANRLVKDWGFDEAYQRAKQAFGDGHGMQ